jgi:ribonuclease D
MSIEPKWIDRDADLAEALNRLDPGPIGVDTEADSMHHYREKVCLIQFSAAGADLLIDPLAEIDLSPLQALLTDPTRRKILHGADYDLRMLKGDFGFELSGLFDTMIAARLVGDRSFGLAALVEKYLGVRLDKRFQRADWSLRPLPDAMRCYAANDTAHLLELTAILEQRLEELGRSAWAEEEFRRMERARPRARRADVEPYTRVKGARRLGRRGLAVLRDLLILREGLAEEADLPRFRIVRDEVLLHVAAAAGQGPIEPERVPGMPRSWQKGGRRRALIDTVEHALGLPEDALPDLQKSVRPLRDPVQDAKVRKLCRARDKLAADLDLESSVLASRTVLDEVVQKLTGGGSVEEVEDLRRWQLAILEPTFGVLRN